MTAGQPWRSALRHLSAPVLNSSTCWSVMLASSHWRCLRRTRFHCSHCVAQVMQYVAMLHCKNCSTAIVSGSFAFLCRQILLHSGLACSVWVNLMAGLVFCWACSCMGFWRLFGACFCAVEIVTLLQSKLLEKAQTHLLGLEIRSVRCALTVCKIVHYKMQ